MTPAFKNALARRGGWIALLDEMPDRVHQVSLAHTHAAIEEQRVIGFRWTLGHGLAGGVCELVAIPDHEGVKGIARIELGGPVPVETSLRGMTDRSVRGHLADETAIVPQRGGSGVIFGRDELNILKI